MRALVLGIVLASAAQPGAATGERKRANARAAPVPFSTAAERCIVPAALHMRVDPYVLRSIFRVESGLDPSAVNYNANGSFDKGLAQTNSQHFGRLARLGVKPEDLADACVSSYVGAMHLREAMDRYGNTWPGIATYHSKTPYFNRRYQILLNNEMVRAGFMVGTILPVPPLNPHGSQAVGSPKRADKMAAAAHGSLVLNE
ncbi:MAG: lytic transglycosylase domain-containing protein [Vicinamibacterales bacterium]